jgi:hypothetical protein
MEEHRLEIGLSDLDRADRNAGTRRGAHQLGENASSVVDDQLDRALVNAGAPDRRQLRARAGGIRNVARSLECDLVVLTDERHELGSGAFRLQLAEVDDSDATSESACCIPPLYVLVSSLARSVRPITVTTSSTRASACLGAGP